MNAPFDPIANRRSIIDPRSVADRMAGADTAAATAVLAEALRLHGPRFQHLLAHDGTRRPFGRRRQLLVRHRRHLDVQVDAVE